MGVTGAAPHAAAGVPPGREVVFAASLPVPPGVDPGHKDPWLVFIDVDPAGCPPAATALEEWWGLASGIPIAYTHATALNSRIGREEQGAV